MASKSIGQLYFLDTNLSAYPHQQGRILRCNTDGSSLQTLVSKLPHLPDGIAIDAPNRHLYWTNMGANMKINDGSIQRCDLDNGSNIRTIVPQGTTHTPKQLAFVKGSNGRESKLYWCDREGLRVMRCSLNGENVETLVKTGSFSDPVATVDQKRWCVGIAVDSEAGYVYWTQKGPSKGNQGRIFRVPIEAPPNQLPDQRDDIECVIEGLPEPIDLHIDGDMLFWTDRGDPPKGNSVNCLKIDGKAKTTKDVTILATKLHEGIGLAIDPSKMLYFTDLAGGVYSATLDGKEKKTLIADAGDCTGIAFVPS